MELTYVNYLEHYGVKGMKWGVRKKDTDSISNKSRDQESARINSKDRVIAKGTEIQNVSRGQYKDRGKRLYTSYTDYDKSEYIALMAGIMYDDRGYVNTFTAKKDIKVPSDQKLVDEFTKLVKENPKQVAKDLSAAEKATKIFTLASENKYSKVMDKVANGDLKKAEKYTNKLVVSLASKKIGKTGDNFQANLVSQGYDAISDLNDRRGMTKTQDPLIVMDTKNSLGTPVSVKLTKREINEYLNLSIGRNEGGSLMEQERKRNDLSNVQHKDDTYDNYLEHYGVKGMKWGVRKNRGERTPEQQARRDKAKSVAKKAAVGLAVVGGAVAVGYATRNTPQVRMAKFVVNSHKNVFKEDIKSAASTAAFKLGEARISGNVKRAQRNSAKLTTNNDFRKSSNIYEAANRLNINKNPPKNKDVSRVIKKVDGGRSLKDSIFDESVRYGANLTGRYVKQRMKQKIKR